MDDDIAIDPVGLSRDIVHTQDLLARLEKKVSEMDTTIRTLDTKYNRLIYFGIATACVFGVGSTPLLQTLAKLSG